MYNFVTFNGLKCNQKNLVVESCGIDVVDNADGDAAM